MSFPVHPVSFWICAVLAVMIVGIAKAGFAGGIGVLATPLLAMTVPVIDAVALLLPLIIVADFFTMAQYRKSFDKSIIVRFIPYAVVGIILGALFFNLFRGHEYVLKCGIGVLAVVFVLFQVMRKAVFGILEKHNPRYWESALLGAITGFTSMIAHAGGPPVNVYLLPQKLPRTIHVGTVAVTFFIISLIKLIPYSALGLLHASDFSTVLVLVPVAFLSVRLGVFMNRHVSDLWFGRVIYTLLFLTGIQLIAGVNVVDIIGGWVAA